MNSINCVAINDLSQRVVDNRLLLEKLMENQRELEI